MQRPRGARSSLGATLTSTSRSRWEAARWRPAYSWPAKTHHGGAGRGARLAVLLRPAGQLLVGALHRAAVQRAQARLARRLGGGRRAAPPERRAPRRQRLLAPVLVLEVAPPLAPQPPQRLLAPGQPARAAALQPTLPYPLSPRTRARLGAVSGAWSRASPPRPRRSAPCSRPAAAGLQRACACAPALVGTASIMACPRAAAAHAVSSLYGAGEGWPAVRAPGRAGWGRTGGRTAQSRAAAACWSCARRAAGAAAWARRPARPPARCRPPPRPPRAPSSAAWACGLRG